MQPGDLWQFVVQFHSSYIHVLFCVKPLIPLICSRRFGSMLLFPAYFANFASLVGNVTQLHSFVPHVEESYPPLVRFLLVLSCWETDQQLRGDGLQGHRWPQAAQRSFSSRYLRSFDCFISASFSGQAFFNSRRLMTDSFEKVFACQLYS